MQIRRATLNTMLDVASLGRLQAGYQVLPPPGRRRWRDCVQHQRSTGAVGTLDHPYRSVFA